MSYTKPGQARGLLKLAMKPMLFSLMACGVFMHAQPAHAGFFNWIDELTTFNKDQEKLFEPKPVNPTPPAPLLYNDRDASGWSYFYTRKDLQPVDYISGSSSKVMRPEVDISQGHDQNTPGSLADGYVPGATALGNADPRLNAILVGPDGRPILGPDGRPITGYDILARRGALNNVAQNPNSHLYMGEAGSHSGDQYGNDQVGIRTQIGRPVNNWNSGPQVADMYPRQGDYDYAPPSQQGQGYDVTRSPRIGGTGQVIAGAGTGQQVGGVQGYGKPNNYRVKPGDTLTGISSQKQIYGNWAMWPLIYDANRNQLSDPDLIRPKQNLGIPRDYTNTQTQQAQQRAYAKKPPFLPNDGQ